MNLIATPSLLDCHGAAGRLFNRQPQLRVSCTLDPVTVMGAIESHAVSGVDGISSRFAAEVAAAASTHRGAFPSGDDDTGTPWGVQGSASVPLAGR
ncbi:MAG TPA: hypothetical protein VNM66_08050 [Thermodesulfobacteriota bacterium]|nr:hypothetical protein [Thermodesulfobacteriota bacterium]